MINNKQFYHKHTLLLTMPQQLQYINKKSSFPQSSINNLLTISNIPIKMILIFLIICNIGTYVNCQQSKINLNQQSQLNNLITFKQSQQQYTSNQTNKITKILEYANRNGNYLGVYQSMQSQSILYWITSSQGDIYFDISPNYSSIQNIPKKTLQKNKNLLYNNYDSSQHHKQVKDRPLQLQVNYDFQFLLLTQRYITQQQLSLSFRVVPKKIKYINQTYHEQLVGNGTQQVCVILGDYQWQCNNTVMNYTKIWRTNDIDQDIHMIRINYRMKLSGTQQADGSYDYHDFKIDFQLVQSEHQQYNPQLQQIQLIHIRSKNSLTILNRRFQLGIYIAYITIIIFIQIFSAKSIAKKLTNNHAMANKMSLFTMSFCTISDLFVAIEFIYRAFSASTYFYALFFALPGIASGFLYFAYDVQILTRVLVTQYNSDNMNIIGLRNPSFKKIFIIYYIFFFISYEVFVFTTALFSYQWWFVLVVYCFVMIPQIMRNVRFGYGGDGLFDYGYILGYLASRNLIAMYEHACPFNYQRIKPYVWQEILLFALLCLQIGILYGQSKLSARFFIPKYLQPNYYNYARLLKISQSDQLQCVICLQKLVPDSENDIQNQKQNLNNSQALKQKMIGRQIEIYQTPCKHLFHQQCLKSWIRVKLECPTCRTKLPLM